MIQIDIPGRRLVEVHRIVSDFTGTLSFNGEIRPGVRERLERLAERVDVHVLTSDTFGTASRELTGLPVTLHLLSGDGHDEQKRDYVLKDDPARVAVFGNGYNDRLMLEAVRNAGGLAVAVDNDEGCAVATINAADLFIHGSENALDLLLDDRRCRATLRA